MTICANCKHCDAPMSYRFPLQRDYRYATCLARELAPRVERIHPVSGQEIVCRAVYAYCDHVNRTGDCGLFEQAEPKPSSPRKSSWWSFSSGLRDSKGE